MILTKKQNEGLRISLERYKNHEKYVVISGYAGTGKSTLVRFIIDALDVEESKVAYTAYTGKAAEVLRKKGNQNTMTLHRLLFDSVPRKGGGFYRKPKVCLEHTIIVVDEVSMVPKSMIDRLLTYPVFVIFLGDPFQLPQIDKDETHDLLEHPHIFLDEIMRQAAESEIIQLTMKIRNGDNIPYTKGKETMVIPKKELVTGHLLWANQILCGTNIKRIAVNNQMRQLLGYSGLPQDGERMICLRNQWDDISVNTGTPLVNGMTGIIHNPFDTFRMIPPQIRGVSHHKIDLIQSDFVTEEGDLFPSIEMDKQMILTGNYSLDWRDSYTLGKNKKHYGDLAPKQFVYGYCITTHKSQGSEWEKILVLEENFPFDHIEHARWLYTSATRASSKLVLVKDE